MEGAAMRRIGCVVGMGLALSVLAAGCAPPVLSVRHRFPADVPLPAGARHVRIGEFVVAEGSQEAFGTFAAEVLAARLQASWAYEVVGSEGGADAVPADTIVSGTLRIEVRDTQGTRRVLRMDSASRNLETVEVPTLVRAAAVEAEFVVREAQDGRKVAAAETRRTYLSTADPRVRGPTGLCRPDHPAHVPPAETVVRELVEACAETFVRMMTPPRVTVAIPLRPAVGHNGRRGLAAAGKGDWKEAAQHFRADFAEDPENRDALFNLAAVSECAGDLATALACYEQVLERSGGNDIAARNAVARLTRLTGREK